MKDAKPMWVKLFHWTVIIFVVVVAAAGLFVSGSPSDERARRLDEQRVNHLDTISYAVDQYWNQNEALPESLEDLQTERTIYVDSIRDPQTGELYDYSITGNETYQLCATFDQSTPESSRTTPRRGSAFWEHGPGHTCFGLDIRKVDSVTPTIVR